MKKLMLGLMMAFAVTAEAAYVDGIAYQFNNDRTAKIGGYDKGNPPTKVDVAEVEREYFGKYIVTSVDASVFLGCDSLETVLLPNVTTIGDYAFMRCSSLTSVSLPNATTLGLSVFSSCDSLETVLLPNVTTIGAGAFSNCKSLSWLIVNDNMRSTLEANRAKYGIPDSTIIVTKFLPEEVVKAAEYVAQEAVVETNLSVVVSTDVKVLPSVTLKSGETVLNETDYKTLSVYYGIPAKEKPVPPEVPAEPSADDLKVVSKDAQVVQEDEIAVKKESIQAPSVGTVKVEDNKVQLGVTVLKTSDLTAEKKEWDKVKITKDNIDVDADGNIIVNVPVDSSSGFMVIQTKDAAK